MIGALSVPCEASLFFKRDHLPAFKKEGPPPTLQGHETLKLEAIYQHHDQDYWIVWINGQRIDSRQPQSISGWYVKKVFLNKVIVRSVNGGQECVLFLGQEWPSSSEEDDSP
jgi:hypothetical protein